AERSTTVSPVRRRLSPCPNCGSSLDEGARYCSTCGQATGAVELEPSPAGPGERAEVTLGASRRRVVVVVAAVAVMALIVAVVVFNGGGSPSRSAPTTVPAPSTPTTVVASTTPTSASPAATTVPVARDAEAAGVVVYLATREGDVVRVDVGTG